MITSTILYLYSFKEEPNSPLHMQTVLQKNNGFTLIELTAVVVLLGILAVTALPRFVDTSEEAKKASAVALYAAFRSTASQLKMQWLAQNNPTSINLGTETIEFSSAGNPIASVTGANGCIELWQEILIDPPALGIFTGATTTFDWTVFNYGSICLYFNQQQRAYGAISTGTPFFIYTPDSTSSPFFDMNF